MPVSITVDPETVRISLDISLRAESLPNPVIALDLYAGEAIREVKDRYEDWATATGDTLTALNTAAAYFTASLIAPFVSALPFFGSDSHDRIPVNWTKRAEILWSRGEKKLAEILDPDTEARTVSTRSGPVQNVAVF